MTLRLYKYPTRYSIYTDAGRGSPIPSANARSTSDKQQHRPILPSNIIRNASLATKQEEKNDGEVEEMIVQLEKKAAPQVG